MIAAVVLLGLALLNNLWVTLIMSVVGMIAGFILVARGPLKRGGIFALWASSLPGRLRFST